MMMTGFIVLEGPRSKPFRTGVVAGVQTGIVDQTDGEGVFEYISGWLSTHALH